MSATPAHADGHGNPHVAHHFDNMKQQFDSAKLGMWLFLATEVLLFSGLFCAYAVFRKNNPEIFYYAHQFLDWRLGAINTIVLLVSSFTAAWAVRNAMLGQRRLLVMNIVLTLFCAMGFMGIKYVEYSHKIHDGLLFGKHFNPSGHAAAMMHGHGADGSSAAVQAAMNANAAMVLGNPLVLPAPTLQTDLAKPGQAPIATAPKTTSSGDGHGGEVPRNLHHFFSIYFLMTGLHGLHVVAGMAAFIWVLFRVFKNQIGPDNFTAVDLAALYWHVVDLVWIFLFPLLYLIH